MTKPKLLWVADNIRPTGFQRVTSSLLKRLCDRYEVVSLAVNFFGDPHSEPYRVYPAGIYGDPLGRDRIRELAESIQPDLIVCLNDIWCLYDYWDRVKDLGIPFIAYFPVDSPGWVPEMVKWLYPCAAVVTYTEFAVKVLREAGYHGNVDILPHGVDTSCFYPVPKLAARKEFGVDAEDFVVFCGQRNQPRKRIDLVIKGFCKFSGMHKHERVKLHLHMGMKDKGWDIKALFKREALKNGLQEWRDYLSLTSETHGCQNIPVDRLNLIYNCADVGINTSVGEGFGLVSFEQAACRVAQIVPAHSACAELFWNRGWLLDIVNWVSDPDFNLERGLTSEGEVLGALEQLYGSPDLRTKMAESGYQFVTSLQFNWDAIALKLHGILQRSLNARVENKPKAKGFAVKSKKLD